MRPLQSASVRKKKDHWDVGRSSGRVQWRAWGLPCPGAGQRSRPSVAIPACVSTRVPRCQRPSCCLLFCSPIYPWRRPIVQRSNRGHGDSPAHRSGADRPLHLFSCAPPVATSPGCLAMFRACHCPLCRSIDGVPASARNIVGDRPAIAPPHFAPLPVIQLRLRR